jgi:hypothetical protein
MIPETNSARRKETQRSAAANGRASLRSLGAPALTLAALAALALLTTASAQGQVIAQFAASQMAVPNSGLDFPYRVAVDSGDNGPHQRHCGAR